jgi:hypothetical protein
VLQFRNHTPFVGMIGLMPDTKGVDTMLAVVKGTFTLGAVPQVAEQQVPVAATPEYYADPVTSSMRVAPDVSLPKPSTDVLLVGSAVAPLARAVTEMLVEVHVGAVSRYARITGDRFWRASGSGYGMTSPEPFVAMPLTWERAFGGREQAADGWHEDPRNPVGTGFRATDGVYSFDGLPVPNVEHVAQPMSSWRDRPAPCGFGPVGPHWEPRRSFAGTYDEAWQQQRAPYLPDDFDSRFLQTAPAESIAPAPLVGGEPVLLRGLAAEGDVSFVLPHADLEIAFILDGSPNVRPALLDTVTFEPDQRRFTMVWRASFPCDKKALKVSEVRATLQSLS